MGMSKVESGGDRTKTVSELNIKVGRVWFVRSVGQSLHNATVLSHGSILLPWLVGQCTSRCAQGGGQGAEEASQQRETKAPPGTEHGPTIAMANVLGEAVHVAGVAG